MVRLKSILIAGVVAVPALLQAADFNWYGSYKQGVYFVTDLPDSGDKHTYSTFQADNGNTWLGISNIGANVKGDKYAGQIELRIGNPKASGSKVYINQAWGSVDFTDKLGLTVGITGTPFWVASAFQGYAGEVDQLCYGGRRGHNDNVMLYQLNINSSGPVSGKFALIHNEGDINPIAEISGKDDAEILESKVYGSVPQMQASASYKSDVFNANLAGAFQTFNLKYKTDATGDKEFSDAENVDVASWAFGFDVGLKFGKVSLLGGFSYGQNTQNMGIPTSADVSQPYYNDNGARQVTPPCSGILLDGELTNTMMWGAPFSITFNFTENAGLTVGYGISSIKIDMEDEKAVTQSSVFANAKFKKACFTFIPEVGFLNYDDYNEAPNQLYYGLFTQVDL